MGRGRIRAACEQLNAHLAGATALRVPPAEGRLLALVGDGTSSRGFETLAALYQVSAARSRFAAVTSSSFGRHSTPTKPR